MFNVYKLTNFALTLFTWTLLSHQRRHLSEWNRIRQTNCQLCVCMPSPFRGFVTTKNPPKNIYKNKCHENEIDTIFNSPCFFMKNVVIQFKELMFVYEKYFIAGVSIVHFTYNDIYICYSFAQDCVLRKFWNILRKNKNIGAGESFFNKIPHLLVETLKKTLQRRCFPVTFVNFLRTSFW